MSDVKYAHYRILDIKQNKLLTNGGVTLAILKNTDGTFRVAGAKCHKNDNYVKREGRVRAKGRLYASASSKVHYNSIDDYSYRVKLWVNLGSKPTFEDLDYLASYFFGSRLSRQYKLIHSGVFKNKVV